MEARQLLTANLAVIDRAVAFAARRHRLEAVGFAAVVRRKLTENDYAILRAYDRRSRLSTYLSVVVQRMALELPRS